MGVAAEQQPSNGGDENEMTCLLNKQLPCQGLRRIDYRIQWPVRPYPFTSPVNSENRGSPIGAY